MTSTKKILLIPPTSVHPHWESAGEEQLLEGIHDVHHYIQDHGQRKDSAIRQKSYAWYISPTLNGALSEQHVYSSSCIRVELIFLCITYGCSVCWNVHRDLIERLPKLGDGQLKDFFRAVRRRMRNAYLILRDVAKVHLIEWTLRPTIPEVAEMTLEGVDFLMSLCVAIYSVAFCLFSTRKHGSVLESDKLTWAKMTLFVAERFESAYSILYKRVWPMYGCQHDSAWEVAAVLAGYSLYYRSKCYATLLHDEGFLATISARQTVALARCTEYLILPLTNPMFGFGGDRVTRYLSDMRDISRRYLPVCEEPVIGIKKIETGAEYNRMYAVVADTIPEADNILATMFSGKEDGRAIADHFVNRSVGTYSLAYHGMSTALPKTVTDSASAREGKPSASSRGHAETEEEEVGKSGVRKPRFTVDLDSGPESE